MNRIIAAAVLAAAMGISASAEGDRIRVFLDGGEIQYDVEPLIINGSAMVPVRATFEAMGMEVTWDERRQRVIAVSDKNKLRITIGSDTIVKNGKKYTIDAPAVIIDDRTLIPLRAVSEMSDFLVEWNGDAYTVNLSSKTYDAESGIGEYAEDDEENDANRAENAAKTEPKASSSRTKVSVYVGGSITLEAASDNENDSFFWTSSDKNTATVDQNGRVTAKYPGKCRIYAESRVTGKKKTYTVSVGCQNTSLRFPAQSKTMFPGDVYTPKLLVTPEDERAALEWESSNKNIASVKNGKITAKTAGAAVITAKTALGVTAEFGVTVKEGGVARLTAEIDTVGADPGSTALQGAPVGIEIYNKSDTDIFVQPDGYLVRYDKSEYDLTLAKFNKTSKVVSASDDELKIAKGAKKVVSFAVKNGGVPEGFLFKQGDKITMYFDCGGIMYEGVTDRNGVINIKTAQGEE